MSQVFGANFDKAQRAFDNREPECDARPTCGKCGRVMTPENSKQRPELFLCDHCVHVFNNCNVCGRELRGDSEFAMGMCTGCANEVEP